jgi:hypothetical protein
MMNCKPRNLAVFDPVEKSESQKPLKIEKLPLKLLNGSDFESFSGEKPVMHGLGYHSMAVSVEKGSSATYSFDIDSCGWVWIEIGLVPNLPVEGNRIGFGISLNESQHSSVEYQTVGRSEEWKVNVLTNQTVRVVKFRVDQPGLQHLEIKALDENVMIDQIKIWRDEPLIDRE